MIEKVHILQEKDFQLKLSITPETKWEDVVSEIRRQAPELNHFDDNDNGRLKAFFELRQRNMRGEDVTEGVKSWRIEANGFNSGLFYDRRGEVITAIVASTESPEAKEMAARHKRK